MPKRIYIYEMNDCDWCAAANKMDAMKALAKYYGENSAKEYMESYETSLADVRRLSDLETSEMVYCEETGEEITFADRLAELKDFPCFFATTEF